MRVIVVGCGRVGAQLALRMFHKGHEVIVVDEMAGAFGNLHPDFQGRTVQGDVLDEETLHNAGIEEAEGLAAVTNSDAVNAVVAHVARSVFRLKRVVVRSYAPSWQPLHEAFGHQTVSSTTWGAQRLEELLSEADRSSVYALGNGEVRIYECEVPAAWDGREPAALGGPGRRVIAVTRAGRAALPSEELQLRTGDVVHLVATPAAMDQLRRALATGRER
ncbi:MAG TPA: NAD-binding protein [Candidatus Polarisedimenticolaceae bacterium]|nr:NAD-binding protein [Candidatus Polarisedimenticolaceae bacterium]